MPWLSYKFGFMIFVPLYPSILIVNYIGVYAYNYIGEDVLFIALGKNWINSDHSRFKGFREFIKKRATTAFVLLSVWPSPIASYLYIREKNEETPFKIFKVIAIGSIFGTFFWGGGLSILYLLFITSHSRW